MFTPSSLAVHLTEATLTKLAVLLTVQNGKARKIDLQTLEDTVMTELANNDALIQQVVTANWQNPIDTITATAATKAEQVHTHNLADFGLSLIQNLSPAQMPISTLQQEALDTVMGEDDGVEFLSTPTPAEW